MCIYIYICIHWKSPVDFPFCEFRRAVSCPDPRAIIHTPNLPINIAPY